MKVGRRAEIPPFQVMEVMKAAAERERAGIKVLHLEVGQPSTPAPAGARRAAAAALESERLGYTQAGGTDALRRRIARYYQDAHGLSLDPARVAVTSGASAGFVLTILAAFDPGDRVGITQPGYPGSRNIVQALDLEVVPIRIGPETGFVPTLEAVAGAEPLQGLLIASPANPTGTCLSKEELSEMIAYCEDRDIRLLSDEIYHGITFGEPAHTALSFTNQAVVVQSFSKYYSMTGWRLGWLVLPEDLVEAVERLEQNLYIAPPTLAQMAGVAAFDCTEELDANVARYARNRDILIEGLGACGIDRIAPPDGAFYLWAEVSHLTADSRGLCRQWLRECGVAATPGIDFDPEEGHRYVRFSFSESTAEITEAVTRLQAFG
jgi:aspartate/methionine/tyrosine aminotransferase